MSSDSFIARLRKRRVFRSAGYYILGAWVILQVGDVVAEPAGLPAWTMTAVLYAVLIGFPIALILGWRYDITEQGLVRTKTGSDHPVDDEELKLKPADFAIIAGLVIATGVAIWQLAFVAKEAQPVELAENAAEVDVEYPEGSIAVLPFVNLSADERQRYLAHGISDTVMHVLAQVDGLEVTARTSSFAFEGQNLSIPEIAKELKVSHILEGSVQQGDNQIRIIARLINTQSGDEVWSEYYDRGMASVFDIQDELAQEVTTALMVKVLGNQDVEVSSGYQPSLAAFEELVRGRDAMETQSTAGYEEAVERFKRAIEIDPEYALAYAELARALPAVEQRGFNDRANVLAETTALIDKALNLDPLLPEGYINRAQILLAEKRFTEAEQAAMRALELRPSMSEAYSVLREIYRTQQRFDEALDLARKAVELDPESNKNRMDLSRSLWDVGRSEAAIQATKEAIRRNPDIIFNYPTLSRQLRQTGRSGEALYWDRHALDLDPESPTLSWAFCLGLLQTWAIEEALTCIEGYLQRNPGDPEATNYLAGLTNNVELGLSNMRPQVEANPNFWYRKMQLADWLIKAELAEETVELFREAFPGLYLDPPQVQPMTIWAAANLVKAWKLLGEDERANALITAALQHIDGQRKLQGTGLSTGADDVGFLALQGNIDLAIDRLSEAIDRDWQFFSFSLTVMQSYPATLLAEPEYQALVDRQAALMDKQYAWYLANRDAPPSDLLP